LTRFSGCSINVERRNYALDAVRFFSLIMTVTLGFGLILSAYKLFDISKFYEWNKAYIIIISIVLVSGLIATSIYGS